MSRKDLWISALKRIQPTMKKAHFITWFQNTAILENKDGKVVLGVPTSFAKDWLSNKYGLKILQAIKEFDSEVSELTYDVHSRLSEKDSGEGVNVKNLVVETDGKKVRKVRNLNEVVVAKGVGVGASKVISQMLNSRYRLDNFVIGNDNRLPHAAATAVSNMPGGIYNPLYIYGNVGLGKTHLLHSIGNEILLNFPDLVVKYLTAETFVSEVVDAIGKRYMQKFKDQYRNVDVFLVDDVQFFGRKDSSQQEFFHTFNALYENNKQIVLTSDRSPSDLDDLDERLKSRFAMGMVVELLLPDFETKMAILNQKCKDFGAIIDPEVLSFMASNVNTSVRGLEGVLRQAIAESQLANRVPTIRCVAEIIRRMDKAQKIIGYDIEAKQNQSLVKNSTDLIGLVADYYNVTIDSLVGKDRHKEIMTPRQICMYLIKNELGESYEKIGMGFGGRNHTTVMHACNKMSQRLKNDIKLIRDINALKRDMGL